VLIEVENVSVRLETRVLLDSPHALRNINISSSIINGVSSNLGVGIVNTSVVIAQKHGAPFLRQLSVLLTLPTSSGECLCNGTVSVCPSACLPTFKRHLKTVLFAESY